MRRSLAALDRARRAAAPLADPHDEAHLAVFEEALRVQYGELELHRRDPYPHLSNLELACYDREYAPARSAPRPAGGTWRSGRRRWTPPIAVARPVSAPRSPQALLPAVRGLADGLDPAPGPAGGRRRWRRTSGWSPTSRGRREHRRPRPAARRRRRWPR